MLSEHVSNYLGFINARTHILGLLRKSVAQCIVKKKAEKKKSRTHFLKPPLEGAEALKFLSPFANSSSQAQHMPTLFTMGPLLRGYKPGCFLFRHVTMSSKSPLSVLSLTNSTQRTPSPHTPKMAYTCYCKGSSTMTTSSGDDEFLPDDCEITVMKKTTKTVTTTMMTTRCSATPQPATGAKMQNKGQFQTLPSTPLCTSRISFAPSSGRNTPDTCAPFPTAPRYSSPAFPTMTKRVTVPVFGPIHYHIPHPDTIVPPPYVNPPPTMWYAVTIGQDIGVFDDWLLVKELMDNITGMHQKKYKSFHEALRQYCEKYLVGAVICCPHVGSRFFDSLPDWEEQEEEYEWGSEEEAATCVLEENISD
ncbi:uncharacterized protein ARMOST_11708 [Armillaria ostoyae]|uniref:Ribonuclease H1 N-terminal domain-containing protein n=1 Tax=Armillaria ostoyae TaxID=47428 RepID=A0A284RHW3_ARMOS|nr:uncharacterized protein ARMOST_11708 [Armillaria ostoyae]